MLRTLWALARDEDGAALLEYALIVSLVSIAVLSALTLFGSTLQSFYASAVANLAGVAEAAQ